MDSNEHSEEVNTGEQTSLIFARSLLKAFVVLLVITIVAALRMKLMSEGPTLFYIAMFIIVGSLLFSIIGIVDTAVFSNVMMGLGIGMGMLLIDVLPKKI